MSEPIVFISRNLIREGRRAEFDSLFANAVDLIHGTKPETSLFAAYVDEGGTDVAIVHAFADAAAMALHFEGSDQRSATVSELIEPAGFEIYGPPRLPQSTSCDVRRSRRASASPSIRTLSEGSSAGRAEAGAQAGGDPEFQGFASSR